MGKKWAVRPMELWNPGAVEQWLEHEAAKGWYLQTCNGWYATLEQGEPAPCRVRVQPHGPEKTEDFEARRDAYEEMGWRFFAVAGRNMDVDFEVYYCDDPSAPELDTDPVAYGWLWEKQLKKAWWQGWLWPLATAAFLVWVLSTLARIKYDTPLQVLLNMRAPLLFALLVLWPMVMAMSARQLYLVHGLRRKLKAGLMPEHDGTWRSSRLWWRIVTWVMLVYWVLYLGVNMLGIWIRPDQKTEDVPYVTTSELLPETAPEDWGVEEYGLRGTVFQPLHFKIRMGDDQQRRIFNETNLLRFEVLAEALYAETLTEYRTGWPEAKETEFDAFDETVLLENGSGVSVLLVRSGKTVYTLWVNFPADLPGRLESLAEDFARFQS